MVSQPIPSPFPGTWLQELDALEEAWQGGDQLTQAQLTFTRASVPLKSHS